MFSQSCARFLVDRSSSEETADEALAPSSRPAPPSGAPVARAGLLGRMAGRIVARWQVPPETLDTALMRLGRTSPHLLDDIGVRVTRLPESTTVIVVEEAAPVPRRARRDAASAAEGAIAAE